MRIRRLITAPGRTETTGLQRHDNSCKRYHRNGGRMALQLPLWGWWTTTLSAFPPIGFTDTYLMVHITTNHQIMMRVKHLPWKNSLVSLWLFLQGEFCSVAVAEKWNVKLLLPFQNAWLATFSPPLQNIKLDFTRDLSVYRSVFQKLLICINEAKLLAGVTATSILYPLQQNVSWPTCTKTERNTLCSHVLSHSWLNCRMLDVLSGRTTLSKMEPEWRNVFLPLSPPPLSICPLAVQQAVEHWLIAHRDTNAGRHKSTFSVRRFIRAASWWSAHRKDPGGLAVWKVNSEFLSAPLSFSSSKLGSS